MTPRNNPTPAQDPPASPQPHRRGRPRGPVLSPHVLTLSVRVDAYLYRKVMSSAEATGLPYSEVIRQFIVLGDPGLLQPSGLDVAVAPPRSALQWLAETWPEVEARRLHEAKLIVRGTSLTVTRWPRHGCAA